MKKKQTSRTTTPIKLTGNQTNQIVDKSGTLVGIVKAAYSNLKTPAEKQNFLREVHSAYFMTLDSFLNDTMAYLTSDEIFHGQRRPISHVKEGEIYTGNFKDFAAKAPFAVRAVVEPSGHMSAQYEGGIFQTKTNGNKVSIQSPRKPKKGEIILEGYWRDTDENGMDKQELAENRKLPTPIESRKPFQGKHECIALLTVAQEKARERHQKGWSNCRICGQKNGSSEFELNGFRWPSGYMHYIKHHNVKPSAEFAGFLVTLAKNNAVIEVRPPDIEIIDESSALKNTSKPKLNSKKPLLRPKRKM